MGRSCKAFKVEIKNVSISVQFRQHWNIQQQKTNFSGTFGLTVTGLLLIPFYFIIVKPPFSNNSRNALEDIIEAFVQMWNNKLLILGIVLNIISIAFFNYAGISVTKELSATTRMVLDSIRTIIIWAFSLAFFHQKFHWLQLIGFLLLLVGMFMYNVNLSNLKEQWFKKKKKEGGEATDAKTN